MDAPDPAATTAGTGGGRARATRRFFAEPRHRVAALVLLFAVCWAAAAVRISEVTGADGLAAGIPLAAAPVPVVVGTFLVLARARPQPWPHLAFALSWGAGAGALAALYANSWSIEAIVDRSDEHNGELLGLTVVAPFVEEATKGAAVLLLLLFRRQWFRGPLDGLVLAATTAAGFAFTENVLYFGRAFGGDDGDAAAETAAIFLGRGILTPFAHPLFTSAIGLALGSAVLMRRRAYAVGTAGGGYLLAVGLHSGWNGAAWKSTVDDAPALMLLVYCLVMLPLLAGLLVVGARLRRAQLTAVARQLPWYVAAGWFTWNEPEVLRSIADRSRQRRAARARYGKAGERLLARYQANATALAESRERATRGGLTAAEFTRLERVLLAELWSARARLQDVVTYTLPTPRWGYGPAAPVPAGGPWQPPGTAWPPQPAAAAWGPGGYAAPGRSAPALGPRPVTPGWRAPGQEPAGWGPPAP